MTALIAALAASLSGVVLAAANAQDATLDGPTRLTNSRLENRESIEEDYPASTRVRRNANQRDSTGAESPRRDADLPADRKARLKQSDFERFVQQAIGEPENGLPVIRRFGHELVSESKVSGSNLVAEATQSAIPSDYIIGIGDELNVSFWGSVEGDMQLRVDRSGRIQIPRVGPVLVAGLQYEGLNRAVSQQVAKVFKNFGVNVTLSKLRDIKVFVTGFVQRQGSYAVSGLAPLTHALMLAGGPSDAGSFRSISLRRANKTVAQFDLYSLLIYGDSSADLSLQAGDIIHVAPVGTQVALIGSVNKPAIFELKAGETVSDLIQMAGGFNAVADRSRLTLERLDTRTGARITEIPLPDSERIELRNGDLLRAFSAVGSALPVQKQNKRVHIEGEVARPGEYILPPGSTLNDALAAAGGLTPHAYVYGAEFKRESVRRSQQENYERALRDLETEFTRATTTQRAISADEAAAQSTRSQSSNKLIERLREVRPTGRIVLQVNPNERTLPSIPLEDGDRLLIPAKPTSVGVFGSVFNGGSFLFKEDHSVADYLRLAGGPTRGADQSSIFVLRANGSVISARQGNSGWLSVTSSLASAAAQPGDTVFVPEELNKTSFAQEAKEWTQILYQFGLGAAALSTFRNN